MDTPKVTNETLSKLDYVIRNAGYWPPEDPRSSEAQIFVWQLLPELVQRARTTLPTADSPQMEPAGDIETINDFLVSSHGEKVGIMRPPGHLMTKDTALRLAAHLVGVAGGPNKFAPVLEAVLSA